MRNVVYAIEKLGGTPKCYYTDLVNQALDTPFVVNIRPDDTSEYSLGVGMFTSEGYTVLYRFRDLSSGPGSEKPLTHYITTCPDREAAAQALFAIVNELAAEHFAE